MSATRNCSTSITCNNTCTQSTSCLMCLSNELVSYIIEFVSPTDIVQSVSLVCKRLYKLINNNDRTCTSYKFWRMRWLKFVSSTFIDNSSNALIKLLQHSNQRENKHIEFDVHVGKYFSKMLSCKSLHPCYCCKDEELKGELETILDRSSELPQWHYNVHNTSCKVWNDNNNDECGTTGNTQKQNEQLEKGNKWSTIMKDMYGKLEERALARLYCQTLCYLWKEEIKEINNMQTKLNNNCATQQSYFTRYSKVTPILSGNTMIEIKVFDEAGQMNVISNVAGDGNNKRNVNFSNLLTLLEQSFEHAWRGALLNYTSFQQNGNNNGTQCKRCDEHHHNHNHQNSTAVSTTMSDNTNILLREHEYYPRYNTREVHVTLPHNYITEECTSLFDFYVCASEETKRQYYDCRCEGFDTSPLLYFDEHDDNNEQNASTSVITGITSTRRNEEGNNELHFLNDESNSNNTKRSNCERELSFAGLYFPITCSRALYQRWRDKVQSEQKVVHHDCVYAEMLNNIYCLTGTVNEVWNIHELHSATHSTTALSLSASTSSISFTEEETKEDLQQKEEENLNSKNNSFSAQETKIYQEEVCKTQNTVNLCDNVLLSPLRHILTYIYLLSHVTICGAQHQRWPLEKKYAIYTRMLGVSGDVVEFRFFYSYSWISYPRMYCTMMFAPAHIDEVMSIKDKFDGTYTEKREKKMKSKPPISFATLKHAQHLAHLEKEHDSNATSNLYTVKEKQHENRSECKQSAYDDGDEVEKIQVADKLQQVTRVQAFENEQNSNFTTLQEGPAVEWKRHAFLGPVDNVLYNHPQMCHCESVSNNANDDANDVDDDYSEQKLREQNQEVHKAEHEFKNIYNGSSNYKNHSDFEFDKGNDFDSNEVYNLFWTGFGRVEVDKSPTISAENFRKLQCALGLPSDFPLSLLWNLTLSASGIGVYVLNEHFVTLLQSYKETFTDVVEREFGLEACYGVLSALYSRR